ncbi:MAG TPA: 2Fe-2S iron-sulfur cluster-binding protein [Polyangiaceae bacterium]|nr:2Fe-2S iron-sulfur cluster-binding protein [Polyangiaceae bacterium]
MAKVRISGSERVLDGADGADLLEVLQAAKFPISTSCGGRASCGLCRLTVVSGQEHLTPLKPEEITHLGNVAKVIGARLACQAQLCGEGEIEVVVPSVEDVEARKRQKSERLRRERAAHKASMGPGGETPRPAPTAAGPGARGAGKIEWRPRKIAGPAGNAGGGQ